MRDLFLLIVFGAYIGVGMTAPFVATLGYLWVDLAAPQSMGYSFLRSLSLSMIMGAAAVVLYVAFDKKQSLKPSLPQVLLLILVAWVTLTSTWALVPEAAWWKWDWASKTILFAFFAPFVINNRVRFEAFAFTFILAIAVNYLPLATKTILTGGRYGSAHTIMSGNSKLAESSTLAMACVMALPLIYALYKHNTLFPRNKIAFGALILFGSFALIATFGTYARTGLVCLTAFTVLLIFQTKRRISILAVLGIATILSFSFLPTDWQDRMSTIRTPTEESSASARLAVWSWTYSFVKENPLGGGFEVYRINRIEVSQPDDPFGNEDREVKYQHGRAFHSMYFEVLGEHGWPGLLLFVSILLVVLAQLFRVYRKTRGVGHLAWINNYALALTHVILILMVGGAFIGVAFQPVTLFAISMALMVSQVYDIQVQSLK